MSLVRMNKNLCNLFKYSRAFATTPQPHEDEYTKTPKYPPILDLSREKVAERKREKYCDEVKAVKTIEEKQIKINMLKYYGFPCYVLHENEIPYNNLELAQHITRTHLIVDEVLPKFYNAVDDVNLEGLKNDIEEALLLEYDGYRKAHDVNEMELSVTQREDLISYAISKHVNRAMLINLQNNYVHLKNLQTDDNPRIESFWFAGGMIPTIRVRNWRKSLEWMKAKADEPMDRPIQYSGSPTLSLRSTLPLLPILFYGESENTAFEVPYFKYDPRSVGTFIEHRRAVNTPGFWPGDSHGFGLISYHNRGHLAVRDYNDAQEQLEALHRQGILASFSWLNAQANFLGFTTYNDITYPLTTQTIITNGKLWSFYVYQLNTMLIRENNPKRNICWATKELKLFDEIKEGKVIGFNDDVLKMIIKFYGNAPQEREGVELRPFLSNGEKVSAEYDDDDKRAWLEQEYKFITSNRPRHHLPDEIYNWEKIYKIDHKTRPLDRRLRPFELFINPFDRKYDDRNPRYIPRKLRPDLPRHKGRRAKEYFP